MGAPARRCRAARRGRTFHSGSHGPPYHGDLSKGALLIEALLALLFGLIIGSFLNVTIHRWPRGRSVIRPRSHCVRCRKMIAWYDNIPLVSYIVLGGRCRYCKRKISIRYPLVELLTGLLFFYLVLTQGANLAAVKICVFAAIMVALTFSDLEK